MPNALEMTDASSSTKNRERLRKKIQAKRDKRNGDEDEGIFDGLDANYPRMKNEVSRMVETELRKTFGEDPEAMKMAQQFIDNPLEALKKTDNAMSDLPEDTKKAMENLFKSFTDEDKEEAPPST